MWRDVAWCDVTWRDATQRNAVQCNVKWLIIQYLIKIEDTLRLWTQAGNMYFAVVWGVSELARYQFYEYSHVPC